MPTLRSIQYLRAFAALSVVLFHSLQWARIEFDIGAAGVDLFFVISGYVMWRSTEGQSPKPLEFLRRRAIRLVPLYWTATLALAGAAALWPVRFPEIDPQPWHVLQSLAFLQHRNPEGHPFPVLAPGWTLNYEAVFYCLFAASLLLPKARRLPGLSFGLVAVGLFGFVHPPAYEMLANPLMLEFLAGVLLARAGSLGFRPGREVSWGLFAAALCWYGVLMATRSEWDLWRPFFWGLPAVMLVAGLTSLEASGGLREIRPLRALGDASYSLYLLHPLIIGAIAVLLGTWRLWLFLPLALGLSCGLAWLCWIGFERPLTHWLKGPLPDPTSPAQTRG